MIPKKNKELTDILIGENIEFIKQPTYTFKYEFNTGVSKGHADKLIAIEQSIYKILNTERYKYLIYSTNYGIEIQDLFGKDIPYAISELKRRIPEALYQDDRIVNIINMEINNPAKTDVLAVFTVITTEGNINIQQLYDVGGGTVGK